MRISILSTLLLFLFTSCVQQRIPTPVKPVVSVSILPQKYFVEQLAGEKVEVNVMVPPGASPETYEPSVSQLSQLVHSAIFMKIGYLGFELSWMDKIRSVNPEMQVINLSDGVELIYGEGEDVHHGHEHNHAGADPHIWMSPRNVKVMVTNMAGALGSLLPEDSLQVRVNLALLLARIDSLDREIGNMLAQNEVKSFMIYHPSLSYFAKDYQLEQLSLEWEGKSPSPSHMKELTDLGRERQISSIFVQVEFDRKNAEVLASEIGAVIVPIDPLDEDWPGQMIQIAEKLMK